MLTRMQIPRFMKIPLQDENMANVEIPAVKISVLMTVYNAEKYLDEAIRSVLEQTFLEFEFIIVDDGSSDRSAEMVKRYADRRIRFFPLEHLGRAAALNYAVAQSAAPLIAVMDADDIAYPHRLQLEYDAIVHDQAIDAVSSSYQMIDDRGNLIREKHLPMSHEAIVDLMPVQCSMCFPSALIRKSVLQQAGMFNEKLAAAIDYDLWLRILDRGMFRNLSDSLIKRRISRTSISSRFRNVQMQQSYEMGMHYLKEKYRVAQDEESKSKISFQLGRLEYYSGTMKNARKHFVRLLWNTPTMFIAWRYYIVSFLGNRLFMILRSTGLADGIGNIFRKSSVSRDYFMP